MTTTGKFIQERRAKLGMSQLDLAKALKLSSAQFISNVERGQCSLSPNRILRVSKILKTNPSVFIKMHLANYTKSYTAKVMTSGNARKAKR